MKLPLSGGEYLFVSGLIYLVAGMCDLFVHRFVEPEIISMCWVAVLWIPVVLPVPWLVRGAPFWRT